MKTNLLKKNQCCTLKMQLTTKVGPFFTLHKMLGSISGQILLQKSVFYQNPIFIPGQVIQKVLLLFVCFQELVTSYCLLEWIAALKFGRFIMKGDVLELIMDIDRLLEILILIILGNSFFLLDMIGQYIMK